MNKLALVKIGGKLVDDIPKLSKILTQFAQIPYPKILVHGGGKSATTLADRLGIQATMVQGRRITDAAMLDIATMVYGGLINKRIVALLQALHQNAIGLTGSDLNVILAHKRVVQEIDYGYAGDIDTINTGTLTALLSQQIIPVLAPLTHDGKGQILNTNADTIASMVASSLSNHYEVSLLYCFEKVGVLADSEDNQSVVPFLSPSLFQQFKANKQIHDGMIPKLDNAFRALEKGVKHVYIGNEIALSHLYHASFPGTQLMLSPANNP